MSLIDTCWTEPAPSVFADWLISTNRGGFGLEGLLCGPPYGEESELSPTPDGIGSIGFTSSALVTVPGYNETIVSLSAS